ncbi:MAG: nitroreductase family protein [Eubacteriales bacterium]|nr:nitroreductase family protein [Eubacteriales bacterium]
MEFTELLNKRTCVRSYRNEPVTDEQMREILEAGIRAPNACNYQSWHFYAVRDKDIINSFNPEIARIPWISDIPLLIVICVDETAAGALVGKFGERGRLFAYQDTAGAANHILLKAADLGLGGCWIGPMNAEKCSERLNIAENHTPVAILTIGTPAIEMPVRDRKPLDDVITVIGKTVTSISPETEKKAKPFKLAHASVPGAVFEDLNLTDSKFRNINMQGAGFEDINMSHTGYEGLTLSEARFGRIDMSGAEFNGSDLKLAEFRNASFENVKITDCNLDGMTIDGINVKEAIEKVK